MKKGILILLLFVAGQAYGQQAQVDSSEYSNPYKIHNSVYRIYQQAERLRASEECLALGDSMYNVALKIGDKKGECIARTVATSYYVNTKDWEKLHAAAEMLRKVSRENGYPQYYYHANSQEATLLITQGNFVEAQELIDATRKEAQEEGYMYGVASCLNQIGNLYNTRGNMKQAHQFYLDAAQVIAKDVPDQTPASYYLNAADMSIKLFSFEKALEELEEAEKYYMASRVTISVMDRKATCYYFLGRYRDFERIYHELEEYQEVNGVNQRRYLEITPTLWALYNHRFEEALELSEATNRGMFQHELTKEVYLRMGDVTKALEEEERNNAILRDKLTDVMDSDLASMATTLENARLNAENARLELQQQRARSRIILTGVIAGAAVIIIALLIFITSRIRRSRYMRKADEDRYNFLVNISHELRTPLTMILGPVSRILGNTPVDDMTRKRLFGVKNQAKRMNTLLDTVFITMDAKEGRIDEVPETMDLNAWVMDCAETFSEETENYEMPLAMDLDDSVGAVRISPKLCSVVFSNVMMNALRNNAKWNPITIRTERTDNGGTPMARVSISDRGAGLGKGTPEELFRRNFSESSVNTGFGLGLAYSKTIVDWLGGRIGVYNNEDGEGATYWFELPL